MRFEYVARGAGNAVVGVMIDMIEARQEKQMTIGRAVSAALATVVALTMVFGAGSAAAQEAPRFEEHPALSHIEEELHEMWMESPERFESLEEARRSVMELDAMDPRRPVNAARLLSSLGDEMVLPMLWALVNDDPMELRMGLETWRRWQVGLVEAVGRHRDERSAPVLESRLEDAPNFPRLVKVTTASIGRSGDVEALERVIGRAQRDEDMRRYIVEGLGPSREMAALDYLVEILGDNEESDLHREAARALGDWLNQGGWQTSVYEDRQEQRLEGRQKAVDAMLTRYIDAPQQVRGEISKSLQLGGASYALERVKERLADGKEQERFDELLRQLESSPLD